MILFWYIVKELIFPFLLATGIISSILMMDQIYQFIPFLQTSGIEMKSIFQMVLFSLPPILMVAIPIGVMIGVYAGVNRISNDYELVVIRTSGISLAYLYKPVLFVASVIAVIVLLVSFFLAPLGVTRLEELKYNIVKKQTRINLSEGRINNFFGQKLIYIFEKEGELLKGIFISDWNDPERNAIIEAKMGRIELDERGHRVTFHLKDGKIHSVPGDVDYRIVSFKEMDYDLRSFGTDLKNLPQRFRQGNSRDKGQLNTELMSNELWQRIQQAKPGSKNHLEALDEFHGRVVTVLSCLCFAVFAMSMAVFDPRNPKAGNIVYMITMMIIFFSLFMQMRFRLVNGQVSFGAVYFPVVLVTVFGLIKFYRINHDMESLKEQLVHTIRLAQP